MTILSTAYFPSISWMAILYKNTEVIIDLHESYAKQSYRNRFYIASANGKMALSVPVKKNKGNQSTCLDISINYSEKWQQVHWRSLLAAYQSSPYFLYYEDEIKKLIYTEYNNLVEMNETIIKTISKLIGFSTNFNYANDFILPDTIDADYRFLIHPKKPSIAQIPNYEQVFMEKHGYIHDLSILDLLFNLGPESLSILDETKIIDTNLSPNLSSK